MSTPVILALVAAASAVGSAVISGVIGTLLGSYLQRRSTEYEIHYSRLHERRAEVMAQLYASLFEVEQSVRSLTSIFGFAGEPTKREMLKEAGERFDEMRRYYQRHAVWLDDDTCKKVDAFLKRIYAIFDEFSVIGMALGLQGFEETRSTEEQKEDQKIWREAYEKEFGGQRPREGWMELDKRVKDEVPKLRQELRLEFREVLGAANLPARRSSQPW